MSNSLTIKQYIDSENVKNRIREVLQNRSSQFIVSLLSTVNGSAQLAKCEPQSVLNAAMTAASLDLPINPNLGFAYIIPYGDQAQFQMGAKGFKQLAMRSGMYQTINETDVREGEYKGINRVTGELNIEWNETEDREKLKVIGYMSYFKLLSGYEKSRYMSVKVLDDHAKRYSQMYKKGFGQWKDDFDTMARKTVIKLLLSRDGLLSSELQTAIESDQGVIDGDVKYPDNKKQSPQEVSEEKERTRLTNYIKDCQTLEDLKIIEASCVDPELAGLYQEKERELEARQVS